MSAPVDTVVRPEYELPLQQASSPAPSGAAARPFTARERLGRFVLQAGWLRKGLLLAVLAGLWEWAARVAGNDLLLPGFLQTFHAFADGVVSGELPRYVGVSLAVLLQGYAAGVLGAFVPTTLAMSSRVGRDLLETLTAMFNPLPAIALLPLALLWFGLGKGSLVFVLVHSVMWPVALNAYAGFRAVPETLRMAGRNYGLGGLRMVTQILVPAALPAILSGLKVGWAFAWRTLIAAELVFGTTSGKGGLGWYIFQSRNELFTDKVFAGLATVIVIGLLFEHIVFDAAERVTVRRWGMQR
jgi:NitT/TauT family transport system permease protein